MAIQDLLKKITAQITPAATPQPQNNTNVVQQNPTATEQQWAQNTTQTMNATNNNSSIFNQEEEKEEKKADKAQTNVSYSEYIADLNSKGYNTTDLGEGEANFAEYGAALSEELKQEILACYENSADTDGDGISDAQEIRDSIANSFIDANGNAKSVLQTADFKALAQQLGYEVQSEYVNTTYIVDNKFDGHYDTDVTNGAIEVITIIDPATGAEIKIADSNGNGAIEIEEVMMNDILQGISSNIDTSYFGKTGAFASSSAGTGESIMTSEATNETQEANKEETAQKEELNEESENKKADKKSKKQTTTAKTNTKTTEENAELTAVSHNRYNEIEQNIIDEYLEKELPEYFEKLEQDNLTDEEMLKAEKIINNAKQFVKEHYLAA